MADANPPLLPKKSDKSVLIVLLVSLIFSVAISAIIYFGFKGVVKKFNFSWWKDIKTTYGEAFFPDQKRNNSSGATKNTNSSTPNVTNTNNIKCRPNMHLENGSCFINVKPCQIENGFGLTTWTGQDWGHCLVNSCQNGYKIDGNGCILEVTGQGNMCTETDGGRDFYNKGITIVGSATGWDFCDSIDGYLVERYCDGNNIEQVSFWCPNGCRDGACIQ